MCCKCLFISSCICQSWLKVHWSLYCSIKVFPVFVFLSASKRYSNLHTNCGSFYEVFHTERGRHWDNPLFPKSVKLWCSCEVQCCGIQLITTKLTSIHPKQPLLRKFLGEACFAHHPNKPSSKIITPYDYNANILVKLFMAGNSLTTL